MSKTKLSLPSLLLILIVAMFSVLLLTPGRAATIYYVAPTGSDSNPGTLDKPFATLSYAATKVSAGDSVYVRGGTYYFTSSQYIASVGTPSAHITYQSYPGEKAILDGSQMPTNSYNLVGVAGQYNDFKDFELRNSKSVGLVAWGGKHIQFLNNVIHDSYTQAIFVGFNSDITSASDINISANTVYSNGLVNRSRTANSWPEAIASGRASNVTITENRVFKNYGIGINFILSNGGLAAKNIVYDNYGANLYLDNATNITVEQNLIYTTNDTNFYYGKGGGTLEGQPASGIQAANEPYDISNPLNSNIIRNNIVIGGHAGFYYGSYGKGGGLKNFVIANNTFYKATSTMLSIDNDAGHRNTLIANNIFYQTGGGAMTNLTANSGLRFQKNLWYGGSAGAAAGIGDVNADPKLFNPGTTTDVDYKLQAGSPAIDTGAQIIKSVPNDYGGSSRPLGKGYDIGAYEYVQ